MEVPASPPKKSRLTLYIIIALFAGIAAGFILNKNYLAEENARLTAVQTQITETNLALSTAQDSITRAGLLITKQQLNAEQNSILVARDSKVEPFSILADIFLRLIKMIVAPLVLTTLIVGVAKLGDISSVGRIGGNGDTQQPEVENIAV